MDTRWLRVFVDLESLGTLRAVSEATGYSTSAVSQHLARLQDDLGATLVEPIGRRLHITPAGQAFLPHARQILRELETGRGQLNAERSLQGVLRVGGFATALVSHVARAAMRLQHDHPGLEVQLEELESDEVKAGLARDSIDLGIVYDYSLVPDQSFLDPYAEIPVMLAVPADEKRSGLDIIADPLTSWIGNSRSHDDDAIINHITTTVGVQARIPHHIDSLHLLNKFIALGYGAALVPSDITRAPGVRYVDIDGLAGTRRSYAVTRPGRESWPMSRALIRAITIEAGRDSMPAVALDWSEHPSP
ncbi:MAG: LysR family transcriptional regulator [Gulosibacter sp.]|uniref:LysR family transcriptional regulator n=1 Tax=Gulosibacter sp. TaxID=2817531 RepID=UPI003F8F2C37